MNTMQIVSLLAGGVFIAAAIGGGVYWYRKRKQQKADTLRPSKPPRKTTTDEDPKKSPADTRARGIILERSDLDPEALAELDAAFPDGWPPDEQTIGALEPDDRIVFAVESKPAGPYEHMRQELITAKVLSVERTVVRARITDKVAHSEHFGSHAGHGFRLGDLVEVPHDKVLVAARQSGPKAEGYNREGRSAASFKPSSSTKQVYKVRPGTPYDLVMPYATPETEWHINMTHVKMERIGTKGLLQQVRFSEDSMRGPVTLRAIDHDPKEGAVLMGRWDFEITV